MLILKSWIICSSWELDKPQTDKEEVKKKEVPEVLINKKKKLKKSHLEEQETNPVHEEREEVDDETESVTKTIKLRISKAKHNEPEDTVEVRVDPTPGK